VELDKLDREVIQLLQKDAQQSGAVLGRRLNEQSATIRRRIRRLIKAGVIRIRAVADPNKMGLSVSAIFALDVDKKKMDSVMKELISHREIRWSSSTLGRFDILTGGRFASSVELEGFLKGVLTSIDGIRDSETFVVLRTEWGEDGPL